MIRSSDSTLGVVGAGGPRPPRPIGRDEVMRSLDLVASWVEKHDYRGWEPFDGLSSWARPLTLGNELAGRILQQVVRQCPWNLRPLLGITRKESTKGRGYMAWGYLTLYRATRKQEYLDKAWRCLEWLDQHRVARFRHHSWSNHYDFVGRGGGYTKDDPITVWTALIGHALRRGLRADPKPAVPRGCRQHVPMGANLALPRERTARGDCLSYLAHRQMSVHNANMLGASLLARVSRHTGSQECRQVSRSAMEYSCSRQRPVGSWWYAEEPKYHWIDNFHTGYNLDNLRYYIDATGDEEFRPQLQAGLAFFKAHFIESDGRPKYYHTRAYPVDIQCAGQAIDTLALFADLDPECLDLGTWSPRGRSGTCRTRGGTSTTDSIRC